MGEIAETRHQRFYKFYENYEIIINSLRYLDESIMEIMKETTYVNNKIILSPQRMIQESIRKRIDNIFMDRDVPGFVRHKQISNISSTWLLTAVMSYMKDVQAGNNGDDIIKRTKASTIISIIVEKANNNESAKKLINPALLKYSVSENRTEKEIAEQILKKIK